jgi:WXG100 family type VII secretion target
MDRLHEDWIGRGSKAFFNEMRGEVIPATLRLQQALEEAGRVTKEISQTMQQADEEASSPFRAT